VHHGLVVFAGIIATYLVFASLGQITTVALSAATLACAGITGGMVISLVVSGIQAQAPVAMRGRVMSMYSITSQVVPALSGVAAGALVNAVGVTSAIQLSGLTLAGIVVLAAWRMPQLRAYSGRG
jgi:MFS family permease